MYKPGGGGVVIGGGGLAFTGAPIFAYALTGIALLLMGMLAYRFASSRSD